MPKNFTHVFQMYTVRVLKGLRNNFVYYLNNKGISASVHFDPPLHKQKYLKKYSRKLKNTEKLSKEIITLPIYPKLTRYELNKILNTIKNWYKKI